MIDKRLLEIKREFLLQKHKECEAIIMQDKFTAADVERLQGYYNMCEEYAGFFIEFTSRNVVDLKTHVAKILNNRSAVMKDNFMDKVIKKAEKKLDDDD